MFRLWGKIFKDNRMVRDTVIENAAGVGVREYAWAYSAAVTGLPSINRLLCSRLRTISA